MKSLHNFYRETQRGGLCRMHAINAYFGHAKYDEQSFTTLCKEFDEYLTGKGYKITGMDTQSFDMFNSNRETVINYALQLEGVHTLTIPIGKTILELQDRAKYTGAVRDQPRQIRKHAIDDLVDKTINCIFAFNANHVYTYQRHNASGPWYRVDSMAPIRAELISVSANDIGFIIPRTIMDRVRDMKYYMQRLFDDIIIAKSECADKSAGDCMNKSLQSNAEITVSAIIRLLEWAPDAYENIIDEYYKYLKKYEDNPSQTSIGNIVNMLTELRLKR